MATLLSVFSRPRPRVTSEFRGCLSIDWPASGSKYRTLLLVTWIEWNSNSRWWNWAIHESGGYQPMFTALSWRNTVPEDENQGEINRLHVQIDPKKSQERVSWESSHIPELSLYSIPDIPEAWCSALPRFPWNLTVVFPWLPLHPFHLYLFSFLFKKIRTSILLLKAKIWRRHLSKAFFS